MIHKETDIKYLYPYWGSESQDPKAFFDFALAQGFDGVEVHMPNDDLQKNRFIETIEAVKQKHPTFLIVLQQVASLKNESVEAYISHVLSRLEQLKSFYPDFINSHTGKDYYSYSNNCKIIEAIENFSSQSQIPVYHEIHRGRFTFHLATTLPYLSEFPEMQLVGDLSHWCVVSESLLQDQDELLRLTFPHIKHLHARVGFEQSPQVNNPFAPEWERQLNTYVNWWHQIIDLHGGKMTITPEFGPSPYMPQMPFSEEPLANQEELNLKMKSYLQQHLPY